MLEKQADLKVFLTYFCSNSMRTWLIKFDVKYHRRHVPLSSIFRALVAVSQLYTLIIIIGHKNMKCSDLAVWVNDTLELEGENRYCEGRFQRNVGGQCFSFSMVLGTMRNWLHLCGFKMMETKKGLYYDGHERSDVVKVIKLTIVAIFEPTFF